MTIEQVRANRHQPDASVQIAIIRRSGGAFQYQLELVTPDDEHVGRLVVEGPEGTWFHIPPVSASLHGWVGDPNMHRSAPSRGGVEAETPTDP
jgi:hypothetical protein